jgi:acyl carrier protein
METTGEQSKDTTLQGMILLIETTLNVSGLSEQSDLIESGIIDSLALINLISTLEEQYRIEITPDLIDFDNFSTPAAMTAMVERCKNEKLF